MTVYVPAGARHGERLPAILNLHGTQSTGSNQLHYSDMKPSADAGRYLVLAPSGVIPAASGFAWNVPGVGTPPHAARDDVAFLDQVIATAVTSLCADPKRVYGTGYSGGGRMISAFACHRPHRLAAIAPVAGLRAGRPDPLDPSRPDPQSCTPARPVPVLTFHGLQDWTNPFQGGGSEYWRYSVPAAQQRWATINNCASKARTVTLTPQISKITYAGCRHGAEVVLYTVADGGHTWPGTPVDNGNGTVTHEINANQLMWRFFQRYRVHPNQAPAAPPG
ncbi:PHB depolymerase family esterase [Actinoplanes sp. NPDC024001]|uniref:alpha/beta hydrolase family esterase n=1 Tax=Actinoplanes sp. NPDC024001 TaxID=3154598 RepID=UPI0033CA8C7B